MSDPRRQLAELLYDAATTSAEKARATAEGASDAEGDLRSLHSKNHAQAALALTQGWLSATKVQRRD